LYAGAAVQLKFVFDSSDRCQTYVDGVRYLACGGAVWVRNDGNEKDPAVSYEIVFKDALGTSHRLTMVHALRIT